VRTGAAAGHRGYLHEAIRYDSDDHLLSVAVPFLLGGVAADEPTIVALGERNAALVRGALPEGCPVEFLSNGAMYARPASAIRSYRELLAGHVANGAGQIRIIGELSRESFGETWDWWANYESAINSAYDEFPMWSMCAYDARTTPAPVLADVARTHPRTALPDGSHPLNEDYTDPVQFLLENRPADPDPLQRTAPADDLIDISPAHARRVVRRADRGHLSADDLEGLVIAVSEVVTNAHQHGRPPVRMRLWTAADRIVVTVDDSGPGPKDPYAGLLPATSDASAGLGLWITHQSCSHVRMRRRPSGFTICLTGGAPYAGSGQ
jgi:anti-sigma regulatory factor (Ser/Thr protein kinase)